MLIKFPQTQRCRKPILQVVTSFTISCAKVHNNPVKKQSLKMKPSCVKQIQQVISR